MGLDRRQLLRVLGASWSRRRQLAAEVAALEVDDDDRNEMLAVASLMESMRATG